jgi:hypothetical protein
MAKLNGEQVLARIKEALDHHRPFSLIRIGDGENVIMAQKSVWSLKEVLRTPWAKRANNPVRTRSARLGHKEKGVTLPNLKLRNQMVRSVRKADIVGILPIKDKIKAPKRVRRPLTNKIFRYYKLKPRFTCDAFINREFASKQEFWEMLRGKRILLITEHAQKLKEVLQSDPYNMVIAGTIIFTHFKQMSRTLKTVKGMKDQFDVALISCGVNAVVLAPEVARLTGKVAIDFGKGPKVIFNKPATAAEKSSVSIINKLGNLKDRIIASCPDYTPGMVSIVIPAHKGLKYLKECIASISRHTPNKLEYLLVDNESLDGTLEYFKTIPNATVIANKVFNEWAEGYHQSFLAAKGEYIVLLSNDAIVTKNWLSRMLWWLHEDSTIGMVGVRTNCGSNHQALKQLSYKTMEEMNDFAEQWSEKHSRQGYKAEMLSDVCLMFHRNLIERIGRFDNRYSLFSGDAHDFSARTMNSGKKLWVANDVFIHRHTI